MSRTRARRVTFVSDSDAWGGAEVYLTHLVTRAGDLGWDASLVCAEPVAAHFARALPGMPLRVVPLARYSLRAPVVEAVLRSRPPDVVAVNLVDPGSNSAVLAAALAVAPTTATLHLAGDTSPEERQGLGRLFRRLGAVLTPSADGARMVITDLGVPPETVHVVPNGVPVPADPAGPAGRPLPRVGALGRLTAQKGFDVLLGASEVLLADGVAFDVVIGGEGRDRAQLTARAAGLPVLFQGFVTDSRRFLSQLDVFCLSSRREALPLALLEAMGEGLPCVATDVGAVRAAVGSAAVVVPPDDPVALAGALRPLLLDPGRRERLGRAARRCAVDRLDAGLMARRTFAVLDRVAGGGPGAAGRTPGWPSPCC